MTAVAARWRGWSVPEMREVPGQVPPVDGWRGRSQGETRRNRASDYQDVPRVPSDLLSAVEAAEHASVGERYIRRLIAERRLPIYRVGRHVRISASDLDGLVEVQDAASAAPVRSRLPAHRAAVMSRRHQRSFGTVRQLSSGRWQARFWDPTTGKQVPASETYGTREDAEGWLAATQTDQGRGTWVDPRDGQVLLGVFAEEWLEDRKLAPLTQQLYRYVLDKYIYPTFQNVTLADIAPRRVRRWNARIAKATPTTAAKAYRLLRAMLNTAVEDELIARNPCRVKGAGAEDAPERPVASVDELEALADAIAPRFKALVLLAAWCSLRREELTGLQRQDYDPVLGTLRIERTLVQLKNGQLVLGPPKSRAGKRTITIPPHVLPDLAKHLATFVGPEPDAFVFTGVKGGPLRPHVLQKKWNEARTALGLEHLHLHDLRHLGNNLAAATGASTKELMGRMGHSTPAAALRYQHATNERDREIAQGLTDRRDSASVRSFSSRPASP